MSAAQVLRGRIQGYKEERTSANFFFTPTDRDMFGMVAVGASMAGLGAQAMGTVMSASSMEEMVDRVEFQIGEVRVQGWLWNSPFAEGDEVIVVGEQQEDHFEAMTIARPADRIMAMPPHMSRGKKAHIRNGVKWWFRFCVAAIFFVPLMCLITGTYHRLQDPMFWEKIVVPLPAIFCILGLIFTVASLRSYMPFVKVAQRVFEVLGWPDPSGIDMVKLSKAQRTDLDAGGYAHFYFRYPAGWSVCGVPDTSPVVDSKKLSLIEGRVSEISVAGEKESLSTKLQGTRAMKTLSDPLAAATRGAVLFLSSDKEEKSMACYVGEQLVVGEFGSIGFKEGDHVQAVISRVDTVAGHVRAIYRPSDGALWMPYVLCSRGMIAMTGHFIAQFVKRVGLACAATAILIPFGKEDVALTLCAWILGVSLLVASIYYIGCRHGGLLANGIFGLLGFKNPSLINLARVPKMDPAKGDGAYDMHSRRGLKVTGGGLPPSSTAPNSPISTLAEKAPQK